MKPDEYGTAQDNLEGLSPWWIFALAALVVVGLWLAWLAFVGLPAADAGPDARGQFGDAFGALNTLFAGLAFAAVFAALVMQSRELRLQRRELKLQREEMVQNREELARQGRILEGRYELEALQARSAAQPLLVFAGSGGEDGRRGQSVDFTNAGAQVRQGEFTILEGDADLRGNRFEVLSAGDRASLKLFWDPSKPPGCVLFEFTYTDANDEPGRQLYEHEPLGHVHFRLVKGSSDLEPRSHSQED